ncbi:MAG: hypothetical protein ACOY4D_11920, partial [Pseudomonadota bacterium]
SAVFRPALLIEFDTSTLGVDVAPCGKTNSAFVSDFNYGIRTNNSCFFNKGFIGLLLRWVFVENGQFFTLTSTGPSSLYFLSGTPSKMRTLAFDATADVGSEVMFESVR